MLSSVRFQKKKKQGTPREHFSIYQQQGMSFATPKRITSGGARLRNLAPGQHSFELRKKGCNGGDAAFNLTGPGNEPSKTFRTDNDVVATELTHRLDLKIFAFH